MKQTVKFYQTRGVGVQTETYTKNMEIDFLQIEQFSELLKNNKPSSYYNIGSADGAPRDGLVIGRKKMEIRGQNKEMIVAQEHIGHGCFSPVAVLDA